MTSSSAVSTKVVPLPSPLTKEGSGGFMRTEKNLPQPILVEEGRNKHHYLSGNGSSTAIDRMFWVSKRGMRTVLGRWTDVSR